MKFPNPEVRSPGALSELTEVVVVVRGVAYVKGTGCAFGGGREPDAGEAGAGQGIGVVRQGVVPDGAGSGIPVEALHHGAFLGLHRGRMQGELDEGEQCQCDGGGGFGG